MNNVEATTKVLNETLGEAYAITDKLNESDRDEINAILMTLGIELLEAVKDCERLKRTMENELGVDMACEISVLCEAIKKNEAYYKNQEASKMFGIKPMKFTYFMED